MVDYSAGGELFKKKLSAGSVSYYVNRPTAYLINTHALFTFFLDANSLKTV